MSKADSRTPTRSPGTSARIPSTTDREEPRPVLEGAAVSPCAVAGAQELVSKVAVAVLHVHEGKSDACSIARGMYEVVDEAIELLVAHARRIVRDSEAPVEHRVPVGDARARTRSCRAGVSAGVCELKAHDEIVGAPRNV